MTADPANAGTVGLLLSGGLDSGILLGHLLGHDRRVRPFYVHSDVVWAKAELHAAQSLFGAMASHRLEPLIVFDMPLRDLYGQHWSISGLDTPRAGTADDAVYLPGRNLLLAIKPALWCAMHGIEELALATLASNPFSDATDAFFRDYESTIARATNRRVRLVQPFGRLGKQAVMRLGQGVPLELTFSCIAPVGDLQCGRCNKCEERQKAFRDAGTDDLTRYDRGHVATTTSTTDGAMNE